jgi:hypothetical protein
MGRIEIEEFRDSGIKTGNIPHLIPQSLNSKPGTRPKGGSPQDRFLNLIPDMPGYGF